MPAPVPIPQSEAELLQRATALAGHTLGAVAIHYGFGLPHTQRRQKGWVGVLLETLLGATAGNRPVPDFEHLGIEMKTLPTDEHGKPRESTYVSTCPMNGTLASSWEDSRVRHKMARVLWIPIVGTGPLHERLIGSPLLWSPSEAEEKVLRNDWETLTDIIVRGEVWNLNARHGEALQLRPKAANAKQLVWVHDEEGNPVQTQPRGFYLRPRFTHGLLKKHFGLS